MHRTIWTIDHVFIFFCCWHVLKAWHLHATKKIKIVEMWDAIFHDLHDVTSMSMNHDENINAFKECGKNNVRQNFNQHFLSDTSMDKSFLDLLLEIWYVIILKLSCLKSFNHFFVILFLNCVLGGHM